MTRRRPRAREAGLSIGELPTGPHNTVTDVVGVRVGHATLNSGEGVLRPGVGRDDHVAHALPVDEVLKLIQRR